MAFRAIRMTAIGIGFVALYLFCGLDELGQTLLSSSNAVLMSIQEKAEQDALHQTPPDGS